MYQDTGRFRETQISIGKKLWSINWALILLTAMIAGFGVAMLYSAALGDIEPWAKRHAIRYAAMLPLVIGIALTDIRFWLRYAYVIYGLALALLVAVELMGHVGMGAQRWINFGFMRLQPSELMKIALVLAVARYFHGRSYEDVGHPFALIPPLVLLGLPTALVFRQPDLGTALLMVAGTGVLFFLAGVRLWKFALVIFGALAALPIAWQFLADYQKRRVTTFLDPESDPLGAGYHIMQSKIALGSGGLGGKGFLEGTQSHLNFLPEKRTDFILPMLAEELGFIGAAVLLGLFCLVMFYGWIIALRSRNQFGRLVAMGVTAQLFLYVFINTGMVAGLLPVVGVPLPLVSYGGSAMLAIMIGVGLIISVYVHRDVPVSKRYPLD